MFTHAARLERWMGAEYVEKTSCDFRNWQGPPVGIMGIPGAVAVGKGGEFFGPIRGGQFASLLDFAEQRAKRIFRETARRNAGKLHAGFSSLADLVSEARDGGKLQRLGFSKTTAAGITTNRPYSFINRGNQPAARGTGGTSGTGVKLTRSTAGALPFVNPVSGDYSFISGYGVVGETLDNLLLIDVLWDMTYNHATSTSTAIDALNRPDRYQTAALAPGNFIGSDVTGTLSATAHTITVTYVDQDGNTAEAAAAYSAVASAGIGTPNNASWFVTLNAGDTGARYLTNIAQSTTAAVTGTSTFFVAHPLVLMPSIGTAKLFEVDGILSAFNLQRVYDDAYLALIQPNTATNGNRTFSGWVDVVQG